MRQAINRLTLQDCLALSIFTVPFLLVMGQVFYERSYPRDPYANQLSSNAFIKDRIGIAFMLLVIITQILKERLSSTPLTTRGQENLYATPRFQPPTTEDDETRTVVRRPRSLSS